MGVRLHLLSNRSALRCAQCSTSHDLPTPPTPAMAETTTVPAVPEPARTEASSRPSSSSRPTNGLGGAGRGGQLTRYRNRRGLQRARRRSQQLIEFGRPKIQCRRQLTH
ncbi:hypothetical protein OG933_02295 [Streptomyces sp. NBC_00016]|uniref:hypothetical protein n=1 Tax=Streptomyces sp. NBC_00016 TaxID=2975622 RepID=UPI00325287E6